MYSYGLLETGCYYLVQENADRDITLIKVTAETDHCMYVFRYNDELTTVWKRKGDSLHDIIECLSDEAVEAWQKQYNSSEDAYYEEDDE